MTQARDHPLEAAVVQVPPASYVANAQPPMHEIRLLLDLQDGLGFRVFRLLSYSQKRLVQACCKKFWGRAST